MFIEGSSGDVSKSSRNTEPLQGNIFISENYYHKWLLIIILEFPQKVKSILLQAWMPLGV